MSDTAHKLTRNALNAMAAEVGTEAGPGATTKEFNRALIESFRANRGVVPGELQSANFLLLTTTSVKSGAKRTTPLVVKATPTFGGIKKARGARSRWSSYYLQSSERAIGHRPTSRCVAAVLRLQRGCGVRGWGCDGLSYHVDCYQRPTDERKGR